MGLQPDKPRERAMMSASSQTKVAAVSLRQRGRGGNDHKQQGFGCKTYKFRVWVSGFEGSRVQTWTEGLACSPEAQLAPALFRALGASQTFRDSHSPGLEFYTQWGLGVLYRHHKG